MKSFRFLFFLLAVSFSGQQLQAQITADPTTWKYEVKKKGDRKYQLIFHLKLAHEWHIYSFKPGGDGSLISPNFDFDKNAAVKLEGHTQEKGKLQTRTFEGIDGAVNYFLDEVTYTQNATITGNTKITGKQGYQVCNEQMCLPPKTISFSFNVKDAGDSKDTATVANAVPATIPANIDTTKPVVQQTIITPAANAKDTTISKQADGDKVPVMEQKPIFILFLLAFVGGLLAITTPCVYSMVPITVSFFTKRSKTRQESIRNAVYYSLSIIIIFTLLGVLISLIFGPQALYKLSSNWIANLFFFIVFIIFGISFLGAFEITLPSSWTSKTDSKANTNSFKGIFFMALTLVIVSFSCTSGIIGPLLVAASKGGIIGPAVGMFGFSLGLALPFTFFAISPGLINKLANAGGWLNQIKVTLGFIEIGLAMKFLSNADLVMHWHLLDREIFIAIWIVISILLGLYLLGKLKLSHDDASAKNLYGQEYVSLFKLFLVFICFTFAVYLVPGMWGAPLKGLGQFLPPISTQDFVLRTAGSSSGADVTSASSEGQIKPIKYVAQMSTYEPDVVRSNGLVTFFDYNEALAAAKKMNKPLMLDFTGITCVNCRLMETNVWANQEVLKRLKNDFVIVSLYCDASAVEIPKSEQFYSKDLSSQIITLGDKNLDLQVSKFGSNSQPFYFFMDGDGNKLADAGYGTDKDATKFVAHLEEVKAKYKRLHP